MYLAGGLRGLGALFDGPGPALVRPAGEEADEPQQVVGALYQPLQPRLAHAQLLEEHLAVLGGQLAYLLLDLGADGQHQRPLAVRNGLYRAVIAVALIVCEAALVHICGVDDRLQAEQVALRGQGEGLLVGVPAAGALSLVEVGEQALQRLRVAQELLVAALGGFFHALDAPLEHLHVGHDELQVDDLDVPRRVAAALHVDDIGVVEAPHHMYDGVGAANVLQKFISQPLALAGALDEPGDVHELDGGGGVFFRLVKLGQEVQPLVRHGHHADVRLDGAEGIVRALRPRVGDGVEQCRLANVRQPDDPEFHV